MLYSSGDALHSRLLDFTKYSSETVTYDGFDYKIHHTQFASYPVRNLFVSLVEGTNADPLDSRSGRVFSEQATEAVENSKAFVEQDVRQMFSQREYVEPSEIRSAELDYIQAFDQSEGHVTPTIQPTATTRREAIAEILSIVSARKASMNVEVSLSGLYSADDRDKPNPGTDTDELLTALRSTTLTNHGPSALSRPDPSLQTTRSVYNMYDEVGINPGVRHVYGLFVSPFSPRMFEPDDSVGHRMKRTLFSPSRKTETSRRWTSKNEPPLDSLDSYDKH